MQKLQQTYQSVIGLIQVCAVGRYVMLTAILLSLPSITSLLFCLIAYLMHIISFGTCGYGIQFKRFTDASSFVPIPTWLIPNSICELEPGEIEKLQSINADILDMYIRPQIASNTALTINDYYNAILANELYIDEDAINKKRTAALEKLKKDQ